MFTQGTFLQPIIYDNPGVYESSKFNIFICFIISYMITRAHIKYCKSNIFCEIDFIFKDFNNFNG